MTIDRALELAEDAMHHQRLCPDGSAPSELGEALQIIGTLRDQDTTLGRLFRIDA